MCFLRLLNTPAPEASESLADEAFRSFHSLASKAHVSRVARSFLAPAQQLRLPMVETISPNKAMEPTPVNVTIPANAGLAPFTSVAHLRR